MEVEGFVSGITSGELGALNEIRRAVGVNNAEIFRRITVGGVLIDSFANDGERSQSTTTMDGVRFGDK